MRAGSRGDTVRGGVRAAPGGFAEDTLEGRLQAAGLQQYQKPLQDAGYDALDLIHFFTAGSDEVKCWTIRRGTLAPRAAGTIHTDFEKGFICAEVMKYDDFVEHKTESAAKAAGKLKQQGKNYEVVDGDIILFKFNN